MTNWGILHLNQDLSHINQEACMEKNDYKETQKDDQQNRRGFLKKCVKCAVFVPPAIYQLLNTKTSHADSPPKASENPKEQEFYDEILKMARERLQHST